MIFHDSTVLLTGDRATTRTHDSHDIAAPAKDVLGSMLETHGDHFDESLPIEGLDHIKLRWTSEATGCALATIYTDDAMTTNVLVFDEGEDAKEALRAHQRLIVNALAGSGTEPGFDLLTIDLRPIIVSTPFGGTRETVMLMSDICTCLAAAFFERVRQA